MKNETIRIKRKELYKRVWETPMMRLAKEYGLSDVGLTKVCKKHNIPRPPRGYWARKASGQQMKKVPLPNKSQDYIIEINPNLTESNSPESEVLQQIENDFSPIVVAKALRNPHLFVIQSADILELCKPNEVGILEPTKKKWCLDIKVSKNSLRRALRIMDALIKALLETGFEVFQSDDSCIVQIYEENLSIGISEEFITQRTQPKDVDLDGYYQFGHSRFESKRFPSGKLCLTIHDRSNFWGENLQKNWRDTKKKQLEDNLDSFVKGLIKRAVRKKEYRLQKEEEERLQKEIARLKEEEQKRLDELKLKIEEERARVDKLALDAENYHKSKLIRDFVNSIESECLKGNSIYVSDEGYENWIKWARDQADRLDPLSESPASILDKESDLNKEESEQNRDFNSFYKKW